MIVIVKKNDKGEIVITEKQLEKWLKEAEDDGYKRGYTQCLNDGKSTSNPINMPLPHVKDIQAPGYGYTLTCKGTDDD